MNKIKRIIFVGGYTPGDAPSNFVVAFSKGYAELGLDVKLIVEIEDKKDLPQLQGIDIYPILRNTIRIVAGFMRERLVEKMIRQHYVPGETVVQYYSSPIYGYIHNKRSYPRFDTIGEVPFANPHSKTSYKVREWMRRLSSRKTEGLLVQTEFLKEYFSNYGIKKIQVYNILIDPKRFSGLVKTCQEKAIVYCGKVSLYKDGVNDLITAFSIVHKQMQNVKLKIIGGFASSNDEKILKEEVQGLGIEGFVEFTGKVLPEKMPQLLFDAEVLALARPNNKQAKYGFPSKLGEYLFTGNPVVLTRVGEIDHFLNDMDSCIFANPDNPKDFAEKLLWTLSNTEEARRIGKRGKQVAEEQFSIQSQCKVALDFFERSLFQDEVKNNDSL
jgi:glycosyltransferase involved in cell wall biosynthesis